MNTALDDAPIDGLGGGPPSNLSTSVVNPRPWEWGKYVTPLARQGFLDKQSRKDRTKWKLRWVVMQDNVLYYFKEPFPASNVNLYESDNRLLRLYRHGSIQLDTVATVCTAEWGPAAFQIKVQERKYIFKADTKDEMNNWLFEFHRSIANLIVMIRSKSLSTSASVTRYMEIARQRQHRSQSFDCRDHVMFEQLSHCVPFDDYAPTLRHSIESVLSHSTTPLGGSTGSFKSPCTSPNYFPFQIDEVGLEEEDVEALELAPPVPSFDELVATSDDSPCTPSSVLYTSPHVSTATTSSSTTTFSHFARTNNITVVVPELEKCLSPPTSTTTTPKPLPRKQAYVPPHLRKGYVPPPPSSSAGMSSPPPGSPFCTPAMPSRMDYNHLHGDSATHGTSTFGYTSLVGKRPTLEDMICVHPDFSPHQSVYALFDGHAGVHAAKYAMTHLPTKLQAHAEFDTPNWRQACTDIFREIDAECLVDPLAAVSGTTASVVIVRGSKLLTANIGDSRAVMSVCGQAHDIMGVQHPGRADERLRIEKAGGWVVEEQELHMNKLHGMDLNDPLIEQKANRVVQWMQIYRVNGELAVSRAIGDIDYKRPNECLTWFYPHDHPRTAFTDSLVIVDPEFAEYEITPESEFFVLACDGLWDTITSQEAVTHVREKLLQNLSLQDVSYSLADLAIRSGSLDNVSVVVTLLKDRHKIT
ncbi:hypothetical protein, variant [Aphanomyces invadans]|uniref:PPM-type phosphatase domain-containing protein n=1 Tax=Aphanomyces invadans TaxID=157072 RepID=A0A024U1T8_9STRA|nr:hypothetical protein, variant [Aphanomyces invadans]ETV99846.1 hypothetical protein, variant [Aphanomyces invadans]|eukprot:XP_008871622.1 hypothetical protein, variant [Aphanomyces invadans]